MGFYTLCFAWREGAVCADFCDRFYPISIVKKEEILRICQDEKIDGISTIASDVAAPTVAYIAEKMGLVGNSYECAVKANHKFLMREAFMRTDIPCPQYKMVIDTESLNDVNWHYPLIVKPSDRSGSLGVQKVNGAEELCQAVQNALSISFKKEVIIEEFLEGVVEVAIGVFHEPVISENQYSGVCFLSKETERLKPINEDWQSCPEIDDAELTVNELRLIECSGDRSGYFIYQTNRKFNHMDIINMDEKQWPGGRDFRLYISPVQHYKLVA